MQNTATFRNVTRGGLQLLVLAAVAAAGVGVGRWVVPDDGSSATSVRYVATTAARPAADILERKLAQMDAEDARHAVAAAVQAPARPGAGAESIVERKLAQMDAEDALHASGSVAGSVPSPNAPDSILERKFAQMEAEDSR